VTIFRFSVSIMPRDGILDPQGRAVEAALPQLGAASVHDVRVGRRVELSVEASDEPAARAVVEQLSADFLANPLVERWSIEATG
jgi:phosphoribosylformylglycinamidine synthase subunit PurS